jgi:hypothetical protein
MAHLASRIILVWQQKHHENAAATPRKDFDELEARELLADELMASPPLTPAQLTAAAANAIAAR